MRHDARKDFGYRSLSVSMRRFKSREKGTLGHLSGQFLNDGAEIC